MIIRFDQSDQLKVSFGRYHTPINWWNTAFHHGQWLQTTISRPEMMQFGGRFLPVHFVGALVEGSCRRGGWNINYQGGVGNGRGDVISRGRRCRRQQRRPRVAHECVRQSPTEPSGSRSAAPPTSTRSRSPDHARVRASGSSRPRRVARKIRRSSPRSRPSGTNWRDTTHGRAGVMRTTCRRRIGCRSAQRLWKPYYRFEHIGIDPARSCSRACRVSTDRPSACATTSSPFAAIKTEYRTWARGSGTGATTAASFRSRSRSDMASSSARSWSSRRSGWRWRWRGTVCAAERQSKPRHRGRRASGRRPSTT